MLNNIRYVQPRIETLSIAMLMLTLPRPALARLAGSTLLSAQGRESSFSSVSNNLKNNFTANLLSLNLYKEDVFIKFSMF